jgi:predicted RNA methylase
MKVEQNILEILERSKLDGSSLTLPPGHLDRKVYEAVNKVIEAAGGKWNRKTRAHVFDGDAVDTIEPIILTGEYTRAKQDFGQFDSPVSVVRRLISLADIQTGMMVLEPNAGVGNIVLGAEEAGGRIAGIEVDAKRLHTAKDRCTLEHGIKLCDFLQCEPEPIFDRVVMNPPFAKQADIAHVTHAAKFLKPGGRLVSVMSASVTFRTDAKTEAFRDFINARNGQHESLPAGAFRESGTLVNAVIVSFGA